MKKALLSPEADVDLQSIWAFIAADSEVYADTFISRIRKKCDGLAAFPEMGRRRDDLDPGLRSFAFGNYLIFYRRIETGIEVARVLSGFRDVEAEFEA